MRSATVEDYADCLKSDSKPTPPAPGWSTAFPSRHPSHNGVMKGSIESRLDGAGSLVRARHPIPRPRRRPARRTPSDVVRVDTQHAPPATRNPSTANYYQLPCPGRPDARAQRSEGEGEGGGGKKERKRDQDRKKERQIKQERWREKV